METKHTPGPWEVAEPGGLGCSLRIFANTEFIAFVGNSDLPSNTKPNARLIAAAPKMLAALQMSIDCLEDLIAAAKQHGKWVSEGLAEDALAAALAAIADAIGE